MAAWRSLKGSQSMERDSKEHAIPMKERTAKDRAKAKRAKIRKAPLTAYHGASHPDGLLTVVLSVADTEPSDERNGDRAAHECFFLSAQRA
jgi:hypothetical protein